jgi:hypothetical protein
MFRRCAGDRYIYAMSWIPSNALEDNAGLLGLSDKGKRDFFIQMIALSRSNA